MSSGRVLYEKVARVAYVTLNRPDVLNAMDLEMHSELAKVWDDFESDDDLWLAVLTGAGKRSFSVGQDIKELVERTRSGSATGTVGSHHLPGWPRLTERHDAAKPIIAKVNGYALGGGFELALACDIILASEDSSFALPEARLGLIPGAGGIFRLTRQIPFRAAMGYLMTGESISAGRAYQLGLVNEVVPRKDLDECTERWIDNILRSAPLSVRAIKQIATKADRMSLKEAFSSFYDAEDIRRKSSDCKEGPLAFVEKRTPKWSAG